MILFPWSAGEDHGGSPEFDAGLPGASLPYPRQFVASSRNDTDTRTRAPSVGQDNAAIYGALGFSGERLFRKLHDVLKTRFVLARIKNEDLRNARLDERNFDSRLRRIFRLDAVKSNAENDRNE